MIIAVQNYNADQSVCLMHNIKIGAFLHIEQQCSEIVADFDQDVLEPLRKSFRTEKKMFEDMGYKVIEK